MRRVFLIFATVWFLFLYGFVQVGAKEDLLNVDHIAGGREKVGEKMSLWLTLGKVKKADKFYELSVKRLAELKWAVENGERVEEAASRYSTYVGRMSEYVVRKKVDQKKGGLAARLEEQKEAVLEMQRGYEHDSGWWLALQWVVEANDEWVAKLRMKGD